MAKPLILIPARFESSRFPGKPLAQIRGKSMIDHVYDRCAKAQATVAVVTDDDRIEQHLKNQGKNVLRVDDPVQTGSERIALAFERNYLNEGFDIVVNVQGDEPLIEAESLSELIKFHLENNFDITTMVKENSNLKSFQNENVVKAIYSEKTGQCLYFSRSSIPFHRNKNIKEIFWQHIGIYCYSPKTLDQFNKLKPSLLESVESLEQLRALENGMSIGAITTQMNLHGVDTPEDIAKIEEILK